MTKIIFMTAAAAVTVTFASTMFSTIASEPMALLGVAVALGFMADK
jgi:hypothetical protein